MDKNKIAQERKDLFNRISEEFARQYIAATYQDEEESGVADGVLSVYLEDVGMNYEDAFAQFYFSPIMTDEDAVQFFTAVVFLTEEINEEKAGELLEALTYINYYLPAGSFSMDEMHEQLIYKLAVPMPIELGGDALYEQVQCIMGNALTFSDKFMDYLLGILDGSRKAGDIMDILKNAGAND